MSIEPLNETWLAEAAHFCATRLLAQAPDRMWIEPASLEDTVSVVETLLRHGSNGGRPLGLVAVGSGVIRAVLAGVLYHLTPEDTDYTYRPHHYSLIPLETCMAESVEIATQWYPPLFAAWREAAAADGVQHIITSQLVAHWAEAAIWRRLGLVPGHVLAAQPCAGWQPLTGRSVPGLSLREALPADLEALADLYLVEQQFHAALPGSSMVPAQSGAEFRNLIQQTLGSGEAYYILAEYTDPQTGRSRPVGYMHGMIVSLDKSNARRLYRPPRHGWLYIASIVPEMRGQGIGRVLCNALMPWFLSQQVPAVFLGYVPTNPISPHFWSRMGFAPYSEELEYRGG